jgi:hypothetical protein
MLLGLLNFIGDDAEAQRIVDELMDAVPAGSYLAIAYPTQEVNAVESQRAAEAWNRTANRRSRWAARPT